MSWQTITVRVPDDLVKEALVGEFSADGISGVWERTVDPVGLELVLYFDDGRLPPLARARITRTFERNGFPVPEIHIGIEGDSDWTLQWRRGFTAFPLGDRFRVVPSWEDPPSGDDRIPLRIDPGMAFGTGTHETTRSVVEALGSLDPDVPVFDLGTGSGILAIAAAKLGARRVLACDLDPDAVFVASSNFMKNGVRPALFVGSTGSVRAASIGLLLANLTSDVLIGLAGELHRVLAPGGRAIVAGVLSVQAAAVGTALGDAGFDVAERREIGEWVSCQVWKRGR